MRKLLVTALTTLAVLSVGPVLHTTTATAGTGAAPAATAAATYGEFENQNSRASTRSVEVGVIHTWKGYGSYYASPNRQYDSTLSVGEHTYYDLGWRDTDGFYVGEHYRVRISVFDPNTGRYVDKGWFDRGQHPIGNTWYIFTDVYNCGC